MRKVLTALACVAAMIVVAPQQAVAATAGTPWPASPNWQSYGEAPASAAVCPTAITSTSGTVSGAANLVCGGSGGATLTMTSGGATPTIVLDYGKEVGGLPYFTVTSASGSPKLQAGYSESAQYLSATGDGGVPWAEGDSARSDTYTVTGAGTITNSAVQGGERYEEITLTSPGTVTLGGVGVNYIADRTQAAAYPGYFVSSNDQFNKIWYDGAYTAQIDSVPTGSLPSSWAIKNGVLDVNGGGVGLLTSGSTWTDYTDTFDTDIVAQQSGWVVRGQDANDGYVFILNAANDTAGTPNTLQELDLADGTYTSIGSVTLPAALNPGTWHTIATKVSGTTLTVSVDGTQVTSISTASYPTTFAAGTIGFREYAGEEAEFRNLSVVSSSGSTLFSNALSTTAAVGSFTAPGSNVVPSILDGAKRDRAIWSGDMNVEGPTVYYSYDNAAYLKGALQLLGSYALSSGFADGDLPPQDALHTGAAINGTTGSYSASYSIYWLLGLGGYYLYTGDTAFVQQEWTAIAAELAWNNSQLDSRGLFITTSGDGADWDFYDGNKAGAVTEYNILYYKALLYGAQLATAAGQSAQATAYTNQAAALKTAINTYLFNSSTGLYNLSDTSTGVAQDANALAVLYGVAPAANDALILAKLKTALWTNQYGPLPFGSSVGDSATISPFISGYELDARLATNDTADAESLLSAVWGHMIAPGADSTGTMWENVSTSGTPGLGSSTSLSHGWSTTPTSALSGYVLGIEPVTPGYATWSVQPHPGDLAWAEGQAPTPHGTIGVSWAGQSGVGQFSMQVTAPSGTTGTIAVPTYGATNPIVAVGGQVVWSNGAFSAVSGITGAHADANFVYLTGVQPGTYVVASNPGNAAVPTGYTLCAAENATCAVTGTKSIAFGANGIYTYRTVTSSTTCDGSTLGDPDYGFVKSCYEGPVTAGPGGTAFCAAENGLCSFAGTKTVSYGAGSTFVTKSLTGGTPCTNTVFGDPDPGVVKACFTTP